jgi:hypothetical protein
MRNFKILVLGVMVLDVLLTITAIYLYNHLHINITP